MRTAERTVSSRSLRLQVGSSVSPLQNPGLQAVLEAVPIGLYVCLPDTSAEWVASQTKLEAGPPGQQVTGNAWKDNVHPDDLMTTIAAQEVASRTGQLPSVVLRLRGPSGSSHRVPEVPQQAAAADAAGTAAPGLEPAAAAEQAARTARSAAAASDGTSFASTESSECAIALVNGSGALGFELQGTNPSLTAAAARESVAVAYNTAGSTARAASAAPSSLPVQASARGLTATPTAPLVGPRVLLVEDTAVNALQTAFELGFVQRNPTNALSLLLSHIMMFTMHAQSQADITGRRR